MRFVRTHFIGGSLGGTAETIDPAPALHVRRPSQPLPAQWSPGIVIPDPEVDTYRFIGTIEHPTGTVENVMAIETMSDDQARKALADLVASLNRDRAEARR